MSEINISVKDAKDLSFRTRDDAVNTIIRLMEERDDLLQTLKHAEGALLDITCDRASILKGVRAAIAKATGVNHG